MPGFRRISEVSQRIRPGVFAELEKHIAAFAARGDGRELIPLHIGDTHLSPPESAFLGRAVADEASSPALHRYGPTAGLPALNEAIATYLTTRRGFSNVVGSRDVHVGAGGTHVLGCAARAVLDPGDDVLMAAPYWPLSHGIFAACGAGTVEVALTSRLYDAPSLDAGEIFADALTPKTKAIYLITPNNPDGKVLSKTHIEQIAAFAVKHDLWVLADEVYADVVFDAEHAPHVSIATLPGMAERTITLYSFSKSFALAGARVGFIHAPADLIPYVRRVSTHTIFNVPLAMQRAALAALESGTAWPLRACATYREARDASVLRLRGAPVDFHVAEGGSYLFLNLERALAGRTIHDVLARAIEHGVLLAPGAAFGRAYENWARLCYTGVPLPKVLEGIDRLRAALG